jgi:hypothetical protein
MSRTAAMVHCSAFFWARRHSDLLNKSIINRVESCIENLACRYHAT